MTVKEFKEIFKGEIKFFDYATGKAIGEEFKTEKNEPLQELEIVSIELDTDSFVYLMPFAKVFVDIDTKTLKLREAKENAEYWLNKESEEETEVFALNTDGTVPLSTMIEALERRKCHYVVNLFDEFYGHYSKWASDPVLYDDFTHNFLEIYRGDNKEEIVKRTLQEAIPNIEDVVVDCILLKHFSTEGSFMVIDPEYEYYYTIYCRYKAQYNESLNLLLGSPMDLDKLTSSLSRVDALEKSLIGWKDAHKYGMNEKDFLKSYYKEETNMELLKNNEKRMTLSDISSLIMYVPSYILLDRDENPFDSSTIAFSGYETVEDIPVKGIYADAGTICIVLDYEAIARIRLNNMLVVLIKNAHHINVVETVDKTTCTGDTLFSINADGELNYNSYFEYMLTKFSETNKDTEKAKAIREGVKDKIKEVMKYFVNNVEVKKDEFTDIIYYVVYVSKD